MIGARRGHKTIEEDKKMSYDVGKINNGYVPTGGNGRAFAPGLEKRMENQDARTSQGVASGSLSQDELSSIDGEQANYEQMLKDFKGNDGKLGPQERMKLHQELDSISSLIYADKHN
jgi:hypothetical protein